MVGKQQNWNREQRRIKVERGRYWDPLAPMLRPAPQEGVPPPRAVLTDSRGNPITLPHVTILDGKKKETKP